MGDFTGGERRSFVRIGTELPVTVQFGDTRVAHPAAFACDLSTGGLGVVIHGDYPDSYGALSTFDGQVVVEIELPGHGSLRVPAEVSWNRRESIGGKDCFRMGLRFLDLPRREAEVLERFVRENVFERLFPRETAEGSDAGE